MIFNYRLNDVSSKLSSFFFSSGDNGNGKGNGDTTLQAENPKNTGNMSNANPNALNPTFLIDI